MMIQGRVKSIWEKDFGMKWWKYNNRCMLWDFFFPSVMSELKNQNPDCIISSSSTFYFLPTSSLLALSSCPYYLFSSLTLFLLWSCLCLTATSGSFISAFTLSAILRYFRSDRHKGFEKACSVFDDFWNRCLDYFCVHVFFADFQSN